MRLPRRWEGRELICDCDKLKESLAEPVGYLHDLDTEDTCSLSEQR